MTYKRTNFEWGIIASIVTAMAYFITFVYQLGYNHFYALPKEFIDIELNNIFIALVAVVTILPVFVMIIELFLNLRKNTKNLLARKIIMMSSVAIMILGPLLITHTKINNGFWYALAFIFFLEFILPLTFIKEKTYQDKLQKQMENDSYHLSLVDIIDNQLGKFTSLILMASVYILWIGYIVGGSTANFQKNFFSVDINGEANILIREYDNALIFAPLIDDKKIDGNFRLIPKSEVSSYLFKSIKIENLEVKIRSRDL